MNSPFTAEHVWVTTELPFEQVTRNFEARLGKYDRAAMASGGEANTNAEEFRQRIEAMAGPSGFMLFDSFDHGRLLTLFGKKTRAIQFVIGNPLFALQMTQHNTAAGLYAPLRVLIYQDVDGLDDGGKTCVEYDSAASLFGQFGDARITKVAAMLDNKLDALIAAAITPAASAR